MAAAGSVAAAHPAFPDSAPLARAVPAEMKLAPLPHAAPEPPDNPSTPAKIRLGRWLFFDPIVSSTRDVACATCHDPRWGWGDGRSTPIGVGGSGRGPARLPTGTAGLPAITRNAPSLLHVGFNGVVAGVKPDAATAPMFWDARVKGLEAQALVPVRTRGEMCGEYCTEASAVDQAVQRVRDLPGYRDAFREAFGPGPGELVTARRLAQSLAAFERTLISTGAPIDRFLAGDTSTLTAEQQQGLRIFQDAGCIQCHGGPMFSDYKLHAVGLPDSALGGQREFRTPTLRNLRHTGPYMHDGSLRTLHDVLVFYDNLAETVSETLDGGVADPGPPLDPLLRQLNLNPDDFQALEAFLDALSGPQYDQTSPSMVPSGLHRK